MRQREASQVWCRILCGDDAGAVAVQSAEGQSGLGALGEERRQRVGRCGQRVDASPLAPAFPWPDPPLLRARVARVEGASSASMPFDLAAARILATYRVPEREDFLQFRGAEGLRAVQIVGIEYHDRLRGWTGKAYGSDSASA